jgi:ABC-2 type transport system permease protein
MIQLPRKVCALTKKELFVFSITPANYGITVFFLVFVSAWLFYVQHFFAMDTASFRSFFAVFPLIFVFVIPVITMKSWAEEQKSGTVEILFTMPFSEWDLVLGKFFSSFGILFMMILLTLPVPLSLLSLGMFEAGIIIAEYVGIILLGSSATALGILLSSVSKNQAAAFLGTLTVLLFVVFVSDFTRTFYLPAAMADFFNFMSLTFHFESFSKGLFDSRDCAFFLITTFLCLFLNTRVLLFKKWSLPAGNKTAISGIAQSSLKKHANIITSLSIVAVILLILLSQRFWFRLDLTKNKAYTISDVSKNIHEEFPDQVNITYYLSDRLEKMHPLPREIEDLLEEYTAYSKGKIRLTIKDPAKAGMIEAVERLGIIPQQIQTVQQDEANVSTVYSGITIEYMGDTEVLPLVFSLETLEYDLTARIRNLVRGIPREAGIILSESDKIWSEDYAYANQTLIEAGYNVREILPGEEIPQTLSFLIVMGGMEILDEWDLYRIDYFIQSGGKVFFALETVAVGMDLSARVMMDKGLIAMVSYYGATVEPSLVLDYSALSFPYETSGLYGEQQIRMARYPLWIGVHPENGNPEHPVTANFSGIDLFWAQPISVNLPENIQSEVLFTSTNEAWLMNGNSNTGFVMNPENEYDMHNEETATKGTKNLAVTLSGNFPSWFAGVEKPHREGYSELPDLPEAAKDSRIIVVSDTDFLSSVIQFTRSEYNLHFFLQAADWLSSDDDIIGIRNRVSAIGRLDRITDSVNKLNVMIWSQALNVIIIPLAIIVIGIVRIRNRKKNSHGASHEV